MTRITRSASKAWYIRIFSRQPMDREILRLAVPAFGALVAEPMFLLADSAMVGHLGKVPLAGLGLASVILQTIIGLMVFLAYSTTPAVARWLGVGDTRRAVAVGIDGLWFALGLGIVLYLVVVGRRAKREGASVWPKRAGIMLGATSGGWLFLRTLTMRIAMVLALDALAIAAQALVGRSLGAGDVASVKAILRRCLEWGVLAGAVLGVLLVVTSGVLGSLFTNATDVSSLLPPTLVILGIPVPLGAVVWVLDGVLIGAGAPAMTAG